jgi:hypothetical protein
LLSVLIDRVVGVLALAAVSAVVILLRWNDLMAHELTRYGVFTAAVILGGSLGFIFVAWLTGRFDLVSKLPQWLPAREKIAEAAGAFVEYARAGKSVGTAFLLSIPAHLLMFSTFWFGSKAFAAGLNLLSVYCVMPIVATVTALPISVGGAGLREGLFIKILGALYGTPESIATLVSLSGFLMQVFWSLVGGAIYLAYRSTDHTPLAEMKESVEELEHRVEHNIEAGRPPRHETESPCPLRHDGGWQDRRQKISRRRNSPRLPTRRGWARCVRGTMLFSPGVAPFPPTLCPCGSRAKNSAPTRVAKGLPPEPLRVVISNAGTIDPAWKIFQHHGSRIVVLSTTRMPQKGRDALAPLCDLHLYEAETVPLVAALSMLRGDYGVKSLVCEGGGTLSIPCRCRFAR